MLTPKRRAGWRKSTFSDQGNGCVDVDFTTDGVEMRHSKIADSPVFPFTNEQWIALLDEVTSGELTNLNGAVEVTTEPNAWTVRERASGQTLVFTDDEWVAFRLGAAGGEFDPSQPAIVAALAAAS
ncbi:DUF397 domain-containing protein [Lentzea terrae]|uniref:DUF397 domain-containing protein n=1 Tax=Lentzea terrae TaxID=2200761 RepID=UPI000DD3E396|nr:DUF397 domain-containing protein [Lentzea terrae]